VIAVATQGPASALWHAVGLGSGSAATGTVVAVTLSPGTPTNALSPGGRAGIVLKVSNPNPSAVAIGSLVLDTSQGAGGFAVDAGHAGCALSALSFATQTNGGAGWTVSPRVGTVNGVLPITLTNALTMTVGAADACQGGSFTIYLAAGP
jgi:hypothetical protein